MSSIVWRPALLHYVEEGLVKNKHQSCAAMHCGRWANQIAANTCGQLFQVNPCHGFRLRASRQSYCQIKIT